MIYHFKYAQREHLRTNLKSLYFMFLVLMLLPPFAGGISILVRWGLLAKGGKSFGELTGWQELLGLTGIIIFGIIYIILLILALSLKRALRLIEVEYKLDNISMKMIINSTLIEIKWSDIEGIKRPAKLLRLLPLWDGLVILVARQAVIPIGVAYLHNEAEFMRVLQAHLPSIHVNELTKMTEHPPRGLWIRMDKRLRLRARQRWL